MESYSCKIKGQNSPVVFFIIYMHVLKTSPCLFNLLPCLSYIMEKCSFKQSMHFLWCYMGEIFSQFSNPIQDPSLIPKPFIGTELLFSSILCLSGCRRCLLSSTCQYVDSLCCVVWDNFSASDWSKIGDVARRRTT